MLVTAALAAAFSVTAQAQSLSLSDLVYNWDFNGSTTGYTSPSGTGTGSVINEGTISYQTGFTGLAGDMAANFGTSGDFYMSAISGLDYSHFSVSLHIKTTQTTAYRDYFSIGTANANLFYLECGPSAPDLSLYNNGTPGGSAVGTGVTGITSTLNDGSWHQIGFTSDGADLRLYIDGALKGTAAYTGAGAISVLQAASQFGAGVRRINTAEDDISLWNVALTGSQMNLLSTTPALQAVPEPSTAALFGAAGLLAIFCLRKRRMTAAS